MSKRFVYGLVWAVWSLMLAAPATAAVQEIQVIGVGVDSISSHAEAKALDYAKKRAVYLAVRKLNVPDASARAANLTPAQLSQIIRGASVTKTRRTGNTTYAHISVTLVDEALRRALQLPDDYGKPVAASSDMKGVLLVPVYVGPDRTYMWEKENILQPLVKDEVRRQSHGSVLLPGGDLEDLRLVDYQNALTVKSEELAPMFARYGAQEIIIAILTPSASGSADPSRVLLRRITPTSMRSETMDISPDTPEETAAIRLAKSAAAIAGAVTQITGATAERDMALRAKAEKIPVRFDYAIPKDFAQMQEIIRTDSEVLYLETPHIALQDMTGTIYLKGSRAQLQEHLIKRGVHITATDGQWRLSLR